MSELQNFEQSYQKLNPNQKKAVDLIDGPVMVLAGPGTGKTQLLSSRVANILKKTDVNPANILCLTYTEAGVSAMRARLGQVLGPAGFQVTVQTFHGFALEVIRRYPDYFLDVRGFEPIDELTSYQVVTQILEELPVSFKLAHRSFRREKSTTDLTDKIAELKKAGLTPPDAKELAAQNKADLVGLNNLLELIPEKFSASKAFASELIAKLAPYLSSQNLEIQSDSALKSLKTIILEQLGQALIESEQSGKATPIKDWKDNFLEKGSHGEWRFKDTRYNQNLEELSYVYERYDVAIQELEKLEFDDMILNLIKALQENQDLKFNVQEQWQYILVDEFQDTSFAQLEIVRLLGDNPASGGAPNIMAVGDDDQAIYAFQGASVSNIQSFINFYPETELVILSENYRSNQAVISSSFQTAQFIEERPAGTSPKELLKMSDQAQDLGVEINTLSTKERELSWIAKDIKKQLQAGVSPEEIAVLAPRHRFLQDLAVELSQNEIPVYYESSSNILEDEVIINLIDLASLVLQIARGEVLASRLKLADVLSAPYWDLPVGSIWKLSLLANQQPLEKRKNWLELVEDGALGEQGQLIARQLKHWASQSHKLTLEQMLDKLIGVNLVDQDDQLSSELNSKFKDYYFSSDRLEAQPSLYASFLGSLSTLRDHLRAYYSDSSKPKLSDLIDYVTLCQSYGGIRIARRGMHIDSGGVNLITAYGSKGLEFEQVYIMHSLDDVWSEKARGKGGGISLPSNFASHKDSADDKTRLFYVAQTRAKNRLVHTLHKFDEKGKDKIPLRYINPLAGLNGIKANDLSTELLNVEESAEAYQQKLFPKEVLADLEGTNKELAQILAPILENYRLSVTHLTTWLNEEYGGKDAFITRHLLRFPQAMDESAVHGSAIHKAIEKAHLAFNQAKPSSAADLLATYLKEIEKCSLDELTKERILQKAEYTLNKLWPDIKTLIEVQAIPEADIKVNFNELRLSGKLDAIVIDKERGTAVIRDYKTGRPGKYIDKKYENQLFFYRLLIEQSPERLPKNVQLTGAELVYINGGEDKVVTLSLDYAKKESEYLAFKELVQKVWSEIMALAKF